MSGLVVWLKEFLGLILMVIVVGTLLILIYTAYNSRQKKSWHKCKSCGTNFRCRDRPTPPTTAVATASEPPNNQTRVLTQEFVATDDDNNSNEPGVLKIDDNGRALRRTRIPAPRMTDADHQVQALRPNGPATVRRRQPLAGFERKTVHLGSLPLEISEPTRLCCATYAGPNRPQERFCSYSCYRKIVTHT